MAILDTIGRIVSNGKNVAPKTWFSCVMKDTDESRSVEDIDNDLSSAYQNALDAIYRLYTTVTNNGVNIVYENNDGDEDSITIKTAETAGEGKAGLMSAANLSLLNSILPRMQGTNSGFESNKDPYYFLGEYSPSTTGSSYAQCIVDMNNDINHLHYKTGESKKYKERDIPIQSLIVARLSGSPLFLMNTVLSYDNDNWVQTAINATVQSNGNLIPGAGICTRTCTNGVWSQWSNILTRLTSIESRLELIEELI